MSNSALANKVWRKAIAENDTLITNNCSESDIAILAKDSRWRSLKDAYSGTRAIILNLLEFKRVQANKLS